MKNKQTKIVATISDRGCSPEFIQKLVDAGMDVARINTAHQMPEDTLKVIKDIRAVSDKIAIMIDIKGPEIRTRNVDETISYKEGDAVDVVYGDETKVCTPDTVYVSYEDFVKDVPVGTSILIDDGELELKVIEKEKVLKCKVMNNGKIAGRKSVNIPGVSTNLPSLTDKDKLYIKFSVENNVDFIAQSFVRHKADVLAAKALLKGESIGIIAKIENREGVDNIQEILEEVAAVMVARGDLGIEIPAEEVPLIQKELIDACVAHSKPVITATQMLQSMIDNPRPTRAEVSDVANAILDGTDAIMLSGETAYGKYPVESIRTMATIARHIESKKEKFKYAAIKQETDDVRAHLAKAAMMIAADMSIKSVVIPTASGATARYLAAFRGKLCIYAECYDARVMRQLALSYGVRTGKLEKVKTTDELVKSAVKNLAQDHKVKEEELIMVLGSTPESIADGTNFLEINTLKNYLKQ